MLLAPFTGLFGGNARADAAATLKTPDFSEIIRNRHPDWLAYCNVYVQPQFDRKGRLMHYLYMNQELADRHIPYRWQVPPQPNAFPAYISVLRTWDVVWWREDAGGECTEALIRMHSCGPDALLHHWTREALRAIRPDGSLCFEDPSRYGRVPLRRIPVSRRHGR